MSARPWMPLYVSDYRGDTAHLSTLQHGAYILLIMQYWQHGNLPDDDDQLARIVGLSINEWRRNRSVLRSFFRDGWRHDRIEREIVKSVEKYEKRSNAGKLGNQMRWKGRNAIPLGSQPQPHNRPSQGEETLEGLDSYHLRWWH